MPRHFQNQLEFEPAFRSGKQATRREEVSAARAILFVSTEQPDAPLPLLVTVAARANDESAASHAAAKRAGGDLLNWIERHHTEYKTIPELLRAAVGQTNHKIVDDKQRRGAPATAGASLALAAFVEQGKELLRLYVVHVGAGRIYLVRESKVYLLTADHSAARIYLDGGYMSSWSEAVKQPNGAELKRFLGRQWVEEGDDTLIPPDTSAPWNPDKPAPTHSVKSIALQKNDQVWLVTPAPYDLLAGPQLQGLVDATSAHTADGLVKLVTTNGAGAAAAVVHWRDRSQRWVFYLLAALLLLAIITFGATLWSCGQDRLPAQVCGSVEPVLTWLEGWHGQPVLPVSPTLTSTLMATITLTAISTQPSATEATEIAIVSPATVTPTPTSSPSPAATKTPTASPTPTTTSTLIPTATFAPTSTPAPTATLRPTDTLVPTQIPTTTVFSVTTEITATPNKSQGEEEATSIQPIQLKCPPDPVASDKTLTFDWSAAPDLGVEQSYELIRWKDGEDALNQGFGLSEMTSEKIKTIDLVALSQKKIIEPGVPYRWGVRVIDRQTKERKYLTLIGCLFRFDLPSEPSQSQGLPKCDPEKPRTDKCKP